MPFFSQVLGKPVVDMDGEPVGKVQDVLAVQKEGLPHPHIVAIRVKAKKQFIDIPFSEVALLTAPIVPLKVRRDGITLYQPSENDIFLSRDILDKQIIDINGVRLVRVNDLELTRVNGDMYVANVDVSPEGLWRRAGIPGFLQRKPSKDKGSASGIISWDSVELLSMDQPMRLKVPGEKLSDLHPADLADILGDMNKLQSGKFVERLDVAQLADTLENVESDFQQHLIENMPDEKVADVLEEMSPDEAADLLGDLPESRSNNLLKLMEDEEAQDVRMLLSYPDESAGGLMTTDYITVRPEMTAEEAIALVRKEGEELETVFYVYVTDADEKLEGALSLSELVLSQPEKKVADIMHKRVAYVKLLDEQDEVAQVIAKYNLLAVPVVDDKNVIQGIVTSDDALDKIIPTAWKKHLPRFY